MRKNIKLSSVKIRTSFIVEDLNYKACDYVNSDDEICLDAMIYNLKTFIIKFILGNRVQTVDIINELIYFKMLIDSGIRYKSLLSIEYWLKDIIKIDFENNKTYKNDKIGKLKDIKDNSFIMGYWKDYKEHECSYNDFIERRKIKTYFFYDELLKNKLIETLSGYDYCVLLSLCRFRDKYISFDTLFSLISKKISDKTLRVILKRLNNTNLVEVKKKSDNKTILYRIKIVNEYPTYIEIDENILTCFWDDRIKAFDVKVYLSLKVKKFGTQSGLADYLKSSQHCISEALDRLLAVGLLELD